MSLSRIGRDGRHEVRFQERKIALTAERIAHVRHKNQTGKVGFPRCAILAATEKILQIRSFCRASRELRHRLEDGGMAFVALVIFFIEILPFVKMEGRGVAGDRLLNSFFSSRSSFISWFLNHPRQKLLPEVPNIGCIDHILVTFEWALIGVNLRHKCLILSR